MLPAAAARTAVAARLRGAGMADADRTLADAGLRRGHALRIARRWRRHARRHDLCARRERGRALAQAFSVARGRRDDRRAYLRMTQARRAADDRHAARFGHGAIWPHGVVDRTHDARDEDRPRIERTEGPWPVRRPPPRAIHDERVVIGHVHDRRIGPLEIYMAGLLIHFLIGVALQVAARLCARAQLLDRGLDIGTVRRVGV